MAEWTDVEEERPWPGLKRIIAGTSGGGVFILSWKEDKEYWGFDGATARMEFDRWMPIPHCHPREGSLDTREAWAGGSDRVEGTARFVCRNGETIQLNR